MTRKVSNAVRVHGTVSDFSPWRDYSGLFAYKVEAVPKKGKAKKAQQHPKAKPKPKAKGKSKSSDMTPYMAAMKSFKEQLLARKLGFTGMSASPRFCIFHARLAECEPKLKSREVQVRRRDTS